MHVIRLPLSTTKYDEQVINKRFHALSHIHNVLVKRAKRLISSLKKNTVYQDCLNQYIGLLKKKELSQEEQDLRTELAEQMSDIRINMGLTEYGLQSYIKKCGEQFKKCLSSQQIQKEATRVWRSVQKYLFSNGKEVHFKKFEDFSTIGGKSNKNGVKFDSDKLYIEWLELTIKCKTNKKENPYLCWSLRDKVSYCEIGRKMFPNGWHYYVLVYLQGDAPKKMDITHDKTNKTGVDIGTSTVATVSNNKAVLRELAPEAEKYNKKIQKLQYHMDLSKRMSNPELYNEDGTVKKGTKGKWKFSNTYFRNKRKLKSLYRQKSAYIKQSHEELCNELIRDSNIFITEEMCFKGLQRKVKETKRQEKASTVTTKKGIKKTVYKYKRKKRYGKSLNNRAPAKFISILERKSILYGGKLMKVNTKEFRASQYDHCKNEYIKCSINDREKIIGDKKVQRDLYSAFLLKNTNAKLDKPNRRNCIKQFDGFIQLHDELITEMKNNNISMKQCFGF